MLFLDQQMQAIYANHVHSLFNAKQFCYIVQI